MPMDDRKSKIMQAIVQLYGLEGEPIGSGVLANYFDCAVSSATLRNEMAALTKLGLLEQPHTSAGRVPSAKGYRFYLDNLLASSDMKLAPQDAAEIRQIFAALDQEPDKLAQGAAKALAKLTGCTAAVTTPRADDLCIAHYEVVQVGRYAAAVLAVTSAGGVRTRVAHVNQGLTRSDATSLAALLNSNLTFVAPVDLDREMLQVLCKQVDPAFVPVVLAAAGILEDSTRPHVFLGGEQYLLQWPELQPYLPLLVSQLTDDERAGAMITPPTCRTTVYLGEDMQPAMPGLCIVAKRYMVGGGLTGTIALVGPARMPFSRLIPVLEACAQELGKGMSGRTGEPR